MPGQRDQVRVMNPALAVESDRYAPDSAYAFRRLALSLLFATVAGAGMWAFVVVLPKVQSEFGVDRAAASAPYTLMMLGFAFGTIVLGRLVDRVGIALPVFVAGLCLGGGFVLAGLAPNLFVLSAAHLLLIGVGTGAGFAPMMADVSHWFVKRRGLAVVVVASGNYLAGAIWPLAMNWSMPLIGWRWTYVATSTPIAT
jgi:MFS family permease